MMSTPELNMNEIVKFMYIYERLELSGMQDVMTVSTRTKRRKLAAS
jgi:hypothetical protein